MDTVIQTVNLNDWVESGGGANGTSYFHKNDPGLMLKFSSSPQARELAIAEVERSKAVYELGIPTPEPACVVFDGRRYGQMYHRIPDKISYARAIGENPSDIENLAESLALLAKNLHSTKCDRTRLKSVKEVYGEAVVKSRFLSPKEVRGALRLLESLPEADTCLHGDFHFGNVIMSHGKSYFIDLGNFCYGHPYFDLAMITEVVRLFFTKEGEEKSRQLYHCTKEQALHFWNCFIKAYAGPDTDIDEIRQKLMPFVAVRQLGIEYETGQRIPDSDRVETGMILRQWIED